MNFDNYPTLTKCLWEDPNKNSLTHYAGEQHYGMAVIAVTSRDASILNQSNWDTMLKIAGGEGEHCVIKRAYHWAGGWVEHMLLKPTAPDDIKQAVEDALNALHDYPVLDDDDLSRREWEAAEDLWDGDRDWQIKCWNRRYPNQQVPEEETAGLTLSQLFEQYPDLYEHVRVLATE